MLQGYNPWLAIPFPIRDALNNRVMAAYNLAFKRARTLIENTIGILKRRFPILGMVLPFRGEAGLTKAGRLIQGLMAIHNLICEDYEDNIETL